MDDIKFNPTEMEHLDEVQQRWYKTCIKDSEPRSQIGKMITLASHTLRSSLRPFNLFQDPTATEDKCQAYGIRKRRMLEFKLGTFYSSDYDMNRDEPEATASYTSCTGSQGAKFSSLLDQIKAEYARKGVNVTFYECQINSPTHCKIGVARGPLENNSPPAIDTLDIILGILFVVCFLDMTYYFCTGTFFKQGPTKKQGKERKRALEEKEKELREEEQTREEQTREAENQDCAISGESLPEPDNWGYVGFCEYKAFLESQGKSLESIIQENRDLNTKESTLPQDTSQENLDSNIQESTLSGTAQENLDSNIQESALSETCQENLDWNNGENESRREIAEETQNYGYAHIDAAYRPISQASQLTTGSSIDDVCYTPETSSSMEQDVEEELRLEWAQSVPALEYDIEAENQEEELGYEWAQSIPALEHDIEAENQEELRYEWAQLVPALKYGFKAENQEEELRYEWYTEPESELIYDEDPEEQIFEGMSGNEQYYDADYNVDTSEEENKEDSGGESSDEDWASVSEGGIRCE